MSEESTLCAHYYEFAWCPNRAQCTHQHSWRGAYQLQGQVAPPQDPIMVMPLPINSAWLMLQQQEAMYQQQMAALNAQLNNLHINAIAQQQMNTNIPYHQNLPSAQNQRAPTEHPNSNARGRGGPPKAKAKPPKSKGHSRRSTGDSRYITHTHPDAIDNFFARYPSFEFDNTRPVIEQFQAMCHHFRLDWGRVMGPNGQWQDHPNHIEARKQLNHAMVLYFKATFGSDDKSVRSWNRICRCLNMHSPPYNVRKCVHAIRKLHINLVDLIDSARIEQVVKRFRSKQALKAYTYEEEKFFPKNDPDPGKLLNFLIGFVVDHDVYPRAPYRGQGLS